MKLLLPLLVLGLGGSVGAEEIAATKPSRGEIYRWITLPGTLEPWQQVDLQPRVSGYIKSLAVDKGDEVKTGQQLAEIEVPELRADLIRHDAEVAAAEVEVNRLHEARKKSPDLILPQAVDDAEARLAIAQAGKDRALTLLEFAQIKAPFDGIITARMADPGAYAAEGGPALFHLVDASTIRLQVPVPEAESALVKVGRPVEAVIDALGGESVTGAISRTSFALEVASRSLMVEADLKNEGKRLHPGMFATVRVAIDKHEDALLVPVAGLVSEKSGAFVFKLADGKAVKTPVKPGFNDGERVEIPDLSENDVILLPGAAALSDGQEVTVRMQ